MKDLFNTFRNSDTLEVDDIADYQVLLLDKDNSDAAQLAVTALTIYQLEHGFDRGRFQLLLWAMSQHCDEEIRRRAMVGLLLVCGRLKLEDEWALENMADLLSYEHDLAFNAWLDIYQSHDLENYDRNFEMLKPAYSLPVFQNKPEMFFITFERGKVESLDDEEWQIVENLLKTWHLCDSDKYAFLLVFQKYIPDIRKQLQQAGIDLENISEMNISFEQISMLPDHVRRTFQKMTEADPLRDYVREIYRFMRLSPSTPLRPTDPITLLTDTMIHRMVVIGNDEEKQFLN